MASMWTVMVLSTGMERSRSTCKSTVAESSSLWPRCEGSGDDEYARERNLQRKQGRLRVKLLDGLHGRAWRRCEHLAEDPDALRVDEGEELVFECLAALDKETITFKTVAFDRFFKHSMRKRGQPMNDYIAEKERL